jgi:hypothetical protein
MRCFNRIEPTIGNGRDQVSSSSPNWRSFQSASLAILFLGFSVLLSSAQVSVVTQHNDISRTGQNTNESILTPANVGNSQFGLLFSLPVDAQVYAQPLYLPGLQIPGDGTHNVLFVATENDSVYAFDADSNGGSNASPLWQASLLSTAYGAAPGATAVPSAVICEDIVPQYGITGTPVIDPVAGILYVVSFTQEGTAFVLRLHALSVTTGAEMLSGPVAIQAQVAGTGNGSSGGALKFDPKWENQRSGLLLLNGVLYLDFASHADNGDWHGWILSYNPSTLAQIGIYTPSPNGTGSGFWMGGDGMAADVVDPVGHPFGRMFVSTGNGDYTATSPYTSAMDYGDSILNFDLTNGIPTIQDEFTPFNQATLNASDGDLGSGGLVILPNQSGPYPHLLFQEGKAGTVYLINRDAMGGYNTSDKVVQEIASATSGNGVWGGPAYWNGNIYSSETRNHLKAYSLTNGVLSSGPTSISPETFGFPGPGTSTSSLGTANGILWAVETDSYDTGGIAILKAYDATNVASEFYSSDQVPNRDSAGSAVKFAIPTISNGKVYVGTGGQVNVYGLFSSEPQISAPVISPASTTFTTPIQVTIADSTPGAAIYYTSDGSAPSTASTLYTGQFTVNSTQTINAIAVAPGYVWVTPVSATYTSLNNTANPIFSPPGGTFSSSPAVVITDASQNALIYYTVDGSMPTNQSTMYTGPIDVDGSETIQAIAFAPGLNGSAITSQTYVTQSDVNFSQGFAQAQNVMTFNGSTGLDDSRLQLTNGYSWDTGSAFVTTPLNIQAFNTNFLFELSNPAADGIAFVIQNTGPTALGGNSASLGYAPIGKSLAIKFDFHNDAGEGPDSTGVYINGVAPTIPAINLSNTAINLASGDSMLVNLTYDGVNLAMTITDEITTGTWSAVWQENIPQIVGGNTAYIGFTGSTQIKTSSQKIATWTYTATTPGQPSGTATPVISLASGTYATTQNVTLTDATPGAVIYYTTDGTAPATSSNKYSTPFPVSAAETLQVMAMVPGGAVSDEASATYAITSGITSAAPTYTPAAGFAYGSMILNGATLVAATLPANTAATQALRLTDGGLNEAASAYFANPVNVIQFTSDFDFQLTSAKAEGFTFVIQNMGLNAVGTAFGYGFGPSGVGTAVSNSVAVAFDINGTAGDGANSVILYVNGTPSTTSPATSLTPAGISLTSGHVLHAHFAYNGTNLTLTLTDSTAKTSATMVYPINIPAIVGSGLAYAGFTGGTGATSAAQNIFDWTYVAILPPTAVPVITPGTGTSSSPTTVTITDATPNAVIYYTINGTTPTAASTVYTGPLPIDTTGTIQAVAQAPQFGLSGAAAASLTIQSPTASYPSGFDTLGMVLNGGASIGGGALQLTDGGKYEARSAYFSAPLNIQQFTTDFYFQQLNAIADGITFVIQNQGLNALGTDGGGIGYGASPISGTGASIGKSVAVKFDLYNVVGQGTDSTGIYTNGAAPGVPAINLTPTGIILRSGHLMHAHFIYDGTNLTLTLTDTTTNAVATEVFPINIPAVVGGNTAYVGFTGGTGNSTATQNILSWTYAANLPPTAVPVITPAGGAFSGPVSVSITDTTPNAIIYYTTNGAPPTTASAVYSGQPITVSATETITAIAQAPQSSLSNAASATFTFPLTVISYPSGFTAGQMALNKAKINGTMLQLTDGGTYEARSAYFTTPVNVQQFSTDFDFQQLNGIGDGFTFVIQNQGLTAVGSSGGGLGYGVSAVTGTGASIATSVAVKFDLYNNSGEGTDSTGIYLDGAVPTVPATNLTGTGIVLRSGDTMHAHIVYDGTNLTLTITDSTLLASATAVYAVNIPSVVGSNTAYVGFTGGTGGNVSTQNILDWTFSTP